MTATPAPTSQPATAWLYGPSIDLLLGCGLAYLLSVPLLLILGAASETFFWSSTVAAILGMVASTPHYGATLLRVYETRKERRRYALFTVHATAFLVFLLLVGTRSSVVGSILITVYFSWSPWHFAGQNYGLTVMFLRRGGVSLEPLEKRLLYASFILSFALSFLALHAESATVITALARPSEVETYRILRLGIPTVAIRLLLPLVLLSYLGTLLGAAVLLLRKSGPRALLPMFALVLTQALWFTIPALSHTTGLFRVENLPLSMIWISTAHAVQYLWVTSYYARREDSDLSMVPYLTKALMAGAAVSTIPALVFAPAVLGQVAWSGGLAMLIFSVVNLHHFILDGAVWKLRDGSVARALLRGEERSALTQEESSQKPNRPWLRPTLLILGIVSVAIPAIMIWEQHVAMPGRGHDADRVERAAKNLARLQRGSPAIWSYAAVLQEREGNVDAAIADYREALAFHSSWIWQNNLAHLLMNQSEASPEALAEAVRLARLAAEDVSYKQPAVLDTLGAAYFASGRARDARDLARRALDLARERRDPSLVRQIEQNLARYESKTDSEPRTFLPEPSLSEPESDVN